MSGDNPFFLLNVLTDAYIFILIIIGLYFLVFIIVFIGIGWKLGDIRNSFNAFIDYLDKKEKSSGN